MVSLIDSIMTVEFSENGVRPIFFTVILIFWF